VQSPIIDEGFSSHHGLPIDTKNHRITDTVTSLKTDGELHNTSEFGIFTVNKTLQYGDFFSEFMDVTTTSSSKSKSDTSVQQHNVTTGPAIAERPRPPTGENPTSAKVEFDHMLEQGVCRPSSSLFASPLHLVSMKTGIWRSCGDYSKTRRRYQIAILLPTYLTSLIVSVERHPATLWISFEHNFRFQ
jgi:hypothetical protein